MARGWLGSAWRGVVAASLAGAARRRVRGWCSSGPSDRGFWATARGALRSRSARLAPAAVVGRDRGATSMPRSRDWVGGARPASLGCFVAGWAVGAAGDLPHPLLGRRAGGLADGAGRSRRASVLIDGILFFVPAKVGTQEGGKVVLFAALGLNPARGLTVGVVRRIRELVYAGLGLVALGWVSTRARHRLRPRLQPPPRRGRTDPRACLRAPVALRTLFLHPPSFEGFDGGAGSRYQARREIRSFWYPTWLAQPAALVPGSRLVDAPPDGLTVERVAPLAREYDQVVMHTSTPSFGSDIRVAERLKDENPQVLVGMVGAHVAVLPEASLRAARAVDWVGGGRVRLRVRRGGGGAAARRRAGHRVPGRGPDPVHAVPAADRGHGRPALRGRRVPAGPDDRELRHRLPPAPLCLALHGTGVPVQVHLLPVAADRRRASLPGAKPRERRGRDGPSQALLSPGPGVLLRRRHVHGRSPARRGDRSPPGPSRHHLVVQREGERPAADARDPAGQRPSPPAGRLRVRESADPEQHQEGRAPRRRPGIHPEREGPRHHDPRDLHPRVFRGRRPRRSRRRSAMRARSSQTRSRSRSRRPYPGHGAPSGGRGAGVAPAGRRAIW